MKDREAVKKKAQNDLENEWLQSAFYISAFLKRPREITHTKLETKIEVKSEISEQHLDLS